MRQGDKYNKFTVVEVHSRNRVYVKCECGTVGIRRASHLESGRTRMCKSCASKETAHNYPPPINLNDTIGDLGRTYYSSLKRGAVKRGLKWDVSQQYLWDIFDGRCKLTGRSINLTTKTHNCAPAYKLFNASLDRIDSSLGYTEGNIQWVHKDINRLKNSYKQEDLIQMCEEVYRYANQQPSVGNDIEVPTKVQRLGGEESNQ